MPLAIDIGTDQPLFCGRYCTGPADALILKRMIARYGLTLVLGEMASVVTEMEDDCSSTGKARAVAIGKRLFSIAALGDAPGDLDTD